MTRRISSSFGIPGFLMLTSGAPSDRRHRRIEPDDWRPGRCRPHVVAPWRDHVEN